MPENYDNVLSLKIPQTDYYETITSESLHAINHLRQGVSKPKITLTAPNEAVNAGGVKFFSQNQCPVPIVKELKMCVQDKLN